MTWRLDRKAALVTGAAHGIGRAIAGTLADAGALVYAADIAWGTSAPEAMTPLTLDVTDRPAVRAAIADIVGSNGSLDILVNNAGVMRAGDFFELGDDDWDAVLAVNARAVFGCIQEGARVMRDSGGGAIVNIASIAGRDARTFSPPYAASKAAVINLTRSSARLLARYRIRVNAVCPGIIDTDFNRRLGAQFGPSEGLTPEEFVANRAAPVPWGRIGTPVDVANVVHFLACSEAEYITGQTVNVDGGLVMS